MKCEFDYCIYNRQHKCLLSEPKMNSLGMCDDCIMVSLDEDFLETEKERQLAEIEERWADYDKLGTGSDANDHIPDTQCELLARLRKRAELGCSNSQYEMFKSLFKDKNTRDEAIEWLFQAALHGGSKKALQLIAKVLCLPSDSV